MNRPAENNTAHSVGRLVRQRLEHAQVPSTDVLVRELLSHELSCAPLEVALHSNDILSPKAINRIDQQLVRLEQHEPIQYVLGETHFHGHRFEVGPEVLIPRPETEFLVEWILTDEPPTELKLLDVGCGSGIIALSLALARSAWTVAACDVSAEALSRTRSNMSRLMSERAMDLYPSDLLENVPGDWDVVVANLPYIPTLDCDQLDRMVVDYEPRVALDGGPDGLDLISRLAQQMASRLNGGCRLYLEIGVGQAHSVSDVLVSCGFTHVECRTDLAGRDRMVKAVCI